MEKENEKNIVDEQPSTRADGAPVVRTVGRDFRVEGNVVDGYIGVSPEYRTYANETEKPLLSQEDVDFLERTDTMTDVERMTDEMVRSGQIEVPSDKSDDDKSDDDKSDDDKSDDDKKNSPAMVESKAPVVRPRASASKTDK